MAMRRTKPSSNLGLFDFGDKVSFTVSPRAEGMVAQLNREALEPVLLSLREWAADAPIQAARALVYQDVEEDDWREVVLEFLVDVEEIDSDSPYGARLWEGLEAAVKRGEASLGDQDVEALNKELVVYLASREDWKRNWGDDSAADHL